MRIPIASCCTLFIMVECLWAQIIFVPRHRYRSSDDPSASSMRRLRERMNSRLQRHRERTTSRVCYDLEGCFEVPHKNSPLQRMPESPEKLGTQFYLFRRDVLFAQPEILRYDDNGTSIKNSHFDFEQPLKVYIHGYQSRWNEMAAFQLADAFLKIDNCNVIIMDWSQGAQGPQYATAAANTEMAGRQLGILLMHLYGLGLSSSKMHLIGFSLGAHVAGCAAEWLKMNNTMIGRITGLDPAGPLFRHNHLKEKSKKLDKTDAFFVDVVHTDGSPVFIDGFGLWEPIGHVDYYANGGEEQPGCFDLRASIVHSTFDRTLNKDNACSHLRAFQLFLESVLIKANHGGCQFVAYKCPGGLASYKKAQCFPQVEDKETNPLALDVQYYTDVGRMGIDAIGDGIMYFSTRDAPKLCGTQLQIIGVVASPTIRTIGELFIVLNIGHSKTHLKLHVDINNNENTLTVYTLSTTEFDSLKTMNSISATLRYQFYDYDENNNTSAPLGKYISLQKLTIRDIYAHSWSMCGKQKKPTQFSNNDINIKLQRIVLC